MGDSTFSVAVLIWVHGGRYDIGIISGVLDMDSFKDVFNYDSWQKGVTERLLHTLHSAPAHVAAQHTSLLRYTAAPICHH